MRAHECFPLTRKRVLCSRYYETVSDVLNSVKKMEESLKRLKQARRTTPANPVGPGGGMSDDDKIRLQLALDVEYLGEQVTTEPWSGASPEPRCAAVWGAGAASTPWAGGRGQGLETLEGKGCASRILEIAS